MTDGILDKVAYQIDADLGPYKSKMGQAEDIAQKTGKNIRVHFDNSAQGAERLSRGIEVSRRELLYLGRELATGDVQRLPGTLLLIGSHMEGLTAQSILLGGAIAAPFAIMATAAYQAERAIDRVNTAILRTGNISGASPYQVLQTAQGLSASTPGLSVRGAIDLQSIMLGSGNVPDELKGQAAGAAYAWSRLTGQKEDAAANELAKMMENPSKAADELERNFFKLDDADAMRIRKMTDVTEQEAALFGVIKKRGDDVTESLSGMAKAFDDFTKWASNKFNDIGMGLTGGIKPSLSIAQQADQAATIASNLRWGLANGMPGITPAMVQSAQSRAGDLHWQAGAFGREQHALQFGDTTPGMMELQKLKDEAYLATIKPGRFQDQERTRLEAARKFKTDSISSDPSIRANASAIQSQTIATANATELRKFFDTLDTDLSEVSQKAEGQIRSEVQKRMDEVRSEQGRYAESRIEGIGKSYDAANKSDQQLKDSIADQTLRNSLRGQDTIQIERQVELQQKIREIQNSDILDKQKEIDLTTDLINKKYALLQADKDIAEQIANEVAMTNNLIDILGNAALDPKHAAKTIQSGITHGIMEYGILNPLKNEIPVLFGGEKGHLPTLMDFGKPKPDGTQSNPMWVRIVEGGASGVAGGGQTSFGDLLGSFIDSRIGAAAPGIQTGALSLLSNAMARGFAPGNVALA